MFYMQLKQNSSALACDKAAHLHGWPLAILRFVKCRPVTPLLCAVSFSRRSIA